MMGPPRKMPSRPSATRILSSDKAERSSSAPPRSFSLSRCKTFASINQIRDDAFELDSKRTDLDQQRGRLDNTRYQPDALKSS
ncbi:unnamed protein product [Caenorhabditis auriculariae]|uniref:Uncharacterized protein n=1 Tax=Caenorhabditis auriculariae TaxID=2777116 RepID=A0A8S1HED3_9PELO|nr:unnamed protein product [Caenorhabditis auriculariae]